MDEDMRISNIENELNMLHQLLNNTDYKIIKSADAILACQSTEEMQTLSEQARAKYGEILTAREKWRTRINELEAELAEIRGTPLPE